MGAAVSAPALCGAPLPSLRGEQNGRHFANPGRTPAAATRDRARSRLDTARWLTGYRDFPGGLTERDVPGLDVYVRFANSTIRFVIALFGSASGSQIVKWFIPGTAS